MKGNTDSENKRQYMVWGRLMQLERGTLLISMHSIAKAKGQDEMCRFKNFLLHLNPRDL